MTVFEKVSIGQPGRGAAARAALLFVLAAGPADADPPYGDDFDAPRSFEAAVAISPNTPGTAYRGLYEFAAADVDYYRFTVGQGQDISISCTQEPYPYLGTIQHPCAARLLDPAGMDRSAGDSSSRGLSTQISFEGADAGEWRIEISGVDAGTFITMCCRTTTYYFSITLAPGRDEGGDGDIDAGEIAGGGGDDGAGNADSHNAGGGGGGVSHAILLLLGAAALLRRRRAVPAHGAETGRLR